MKRFALILAISGCATNGQPPPGQPEPPINAEVAVTSLRPDEQEQLEASLCKLPAVSDCHRKSSGREVVYAFNYAGSLNALQREIRGIPSPGLEVEEVKAELRFRGFDNQPPTITVLSPKEGALVTETKVEVVVEAPDKDTASVKIGGKSATKQRPGIYSTKLDLAEGDNKIDIVATDEGGNEADVTLNINVDTTPPDLEATVKVVVEGKVERGSTVFVDGVQVPVDLLGNWRIEIPVKKGQKSVEVVAIDQNGNKTTETRALGL
jgi:hypothetical protein